MELNGVDKCTWIEKKESNIKIDRSIDRDSEKHLIQNVSWLLKRTRERCTRSSNQSFSTNLVSEIHIHSYNNPGKEQAEYSNPIFRKRLKFPFAILPLSLLPSRVASAQREQEKARKWETWERLGGRGDVRAAEGTNAARRWTRVARVRASGSCVWRLARVASWVAHARMWASIRGHATLSLSFCHTHASLRCSSTCTHTRACTRARARAQVCRGDIGARTCSQSEKKNTGAGLLRGAAGKASGF